jgi:ArsR family transcriptional regulator
MPEHMNNPSRIVRGRARRASRSRAVVPAPGAVARRVRAALRDTARIERLARTFRALGDAGRSKLILALSMSELCVGDLAAALGASPSATSHQLRILRDLDLVRVRRVGRSQLYALNEAGFGLCSPRVCQSWREALGAGGFVGVDAVRGSRRRDV